MNHADTVPMSVIRATVKRTLPNELFLVETADGHELTVHVSGKMRNAFIRLLPGDPVFVETSPFDATKGRIVLRPSGRAPATETKP